MSDHFQTEPFPPLPGYNPPPRIDGPTLPDWLAVRLLRDFEQVTWVRGPRTSPAWEEAVTNPALVVAALPLAVVCLFVGMLAAGSWAALHPAFAVVALGLAFGPILVLGACSGHFTRLVVTNRRLFIVQGRELCRSWDLDELPAHLIRYTMRGDGGEARSVDLDAVKTMLAGLSDKFTESRSIVEFGKKLDQITLRDRRIP